MACFAFVWMTEAMMARSTTPTVRAMPDPESDAGRTFSMGSNGSGALLGSNMLLMFTGIAMMMDTTSSLNYRTSAEVTEEWYIQAAA